MSFVKKNIGCLDLWGKKYYNITMNMKLPELLAPAGNMEKMKAALRFGADAVYLAGKVFGMRAAADNFTLEEIKEACDYAHAMGKKVYVTVNTMPRTEEYSRLAEYLTGLSHTGADALIVADPGVLSYAKKYAPNIELHLSTQTGTVSAADCIFWAEMGVKRVVLARELSLKDIKAIRAAIPDDIELEAFVHGSMCVSFSGRCLLSENLVGRDANRGACAQPCRWKFDRYEIAEEKRRDMRFPVEQTPDGTFILSSKDMCMIEHIDDLCRCGISSLKIEGRMKSAYYTAVCSNTYRMALDAYAADPEHFTPDPKWMEELCSVSHREYCTGYWYDDPMENAQLTADLGYIKDKAFLAVVEDCSDGVATLTQRNKFSVGDSIELLTPGKCGKALTVEALFDENGEPIDSVPHPYMTFRMPTPIPMKAGDIIRGK